MLTEYIGVTRLRDLIARRTEVTETVEIAAFPRLILAVYQPELGVEGSVTAGATVELRVGFQRKPGKLPTVKGNVSGELTLCCQRCLQPMNWSADVDFELGLRLERLRPDDSRPESVGSVKAGSVKADGSGEDFNDDRFDELIVGLDGLRVVELVEDEVLGALPLAPVHEDASDCESFGDNYLIDAEKEESPAENHPLAGLADLLAGTDEPKD
jgi:uncharacterized protein